VAAQGTGKDFVGVHHLGFWVMTRSNQASKPKLAAPPWIMGDPHHRGGYEVKYTDPAG
jgi:hypothetical protein